MAAIAPVGTVPDIYKSWESRPRSAFRPHLGASEIGRECHRAIWYSFRWALGKSFDGRMLRLLDRGEREEAVIVNDLRLSGVVVHDRDNGGKQFRVELFGGHFAGHLDGFALGIKEAPKTWHLLEFKTMNDKRFKELTTKGVKEAKPEHWSQMQVYMGLAHLDRAAYFSVNKNDDSIYFERVEFDRGAFQALVSKAEQIIRSESPPPRISNNATWYACKFCDYHSICHTAALPLVNCRTCGWSQPTPEGTWKCEQNGNPSLSQEQQMSGCGEHRYIPIMLEKIANPVAASEEQNWVQYELNSAVSPEGGKFVNGPRPGLSSAEIRDCKHPSILGHPALESALAQFPNARIVNVAETSHEAPPGSAT